MPRKKAPAPAPDDDNKKRRSSQYQARKDRERDRQAEQSRAGRDIGPIPEVKNKKLRAEVTKSFKRFCEVVFKERCYLGWSPDHLEVLERIQNSIDRGMVYALAMPRGSGKSVLVTSAALWAIVTGRRRYVALIGADKESAQELLAGLKVALETNDKLMELFPEACWPVRCLEGKANKATGQVCNGKRTYIQWKGPRIVFAAVDDAPCSQAIIEVRGILGRVRGMQFTRSDGFIARPDFFVLDDPQTDKSALSETQIRRRLSIITGAVLGLSGPDKAMCGFATVTVIAQDDVADQLLDSKRFPDWQGKRYQLIYKWPTNTDLWEQYATLRAECLEKYGHFEEATEFYRKNREAMDAGAKVAWEHRMEPGEISALQYVFNKKLKVPEQFDAEYQNKPKGEASDVELQPVAAIEVKCHGYKRSELPPEATTATSFIDVQGKLLYYVTCAWNASNFSGWVLEYGSWPEQTAKYYVLRTVEKTLNKRFPKMGLEARLRAGLFELIDYLDAKVYRGPAGQTMRNQAIGIDAAWGPSTKVVQAVAREHPKSARLMPMFGRGIGPDQMPMEAWSPKDGEHRGMNWVIRPTVGGGRHCVTDSNFWKSFLHARWNVPLGDGGCMSLYTPQLQTEHRMFAEHQRAEQVKTETGKSKQLEVWSMPSKKPDNHFFDCLYQNCVLASIAGCHLPEITTARRFKAKVKPRRKTRLVI